MEHPDSSPPHTPWEDYSRTRLQRGFSHVVGRSVVEEALTAADARIHSLSFGPHYWGPGAAWEIIFDVYWIGENRARYFNSGPLRAPHERLSMRWYAVPATSRARLAEEITPVWLPQACAWAARATTRGNVWSATEHHWMLKNQDGELTVVES